MPGVLDYILNGLEAELSLERELGVRFVACNREILAPSRPVCATAAEPKAVSPAAPLHSASAALARPSPVAPSPAVPRPSAALPPSSAGARPPQSEAAFDFVFLHDKPLSPDGSEMMAKIVAALGRTPETAPVVVEPPLPKAKVYIVLGSLALAKFLPNRRAVPGQWIKSENGADVLVTYSPHKILCYKVVSPAIQQMKQSMWLSLKTVVRRLSATT